MEKWYRVNDPSKLISPSLLVYPERIKKNIDLMIEMAGGVDFLRPHIKTHKMAEIIKMQMDKGIYKFKCATIAEAELLTKCKVADILLAMQPVAKNVNRFFELIEQYPNSNFSTIVDNLQSAKEISNLSSTKSLPVSLWMDINNGMNRTGIEPDEKAVELYQFIVADKNLVAKGFHVYDGHIRNSNIVERKKICDEAFEKVIQLKDKLKSLGIVVKNIIAGGTPTFPIHSKRKDIDVSPGTTLLWDEGYGNMFQDMEFLHAAALFTRVISKPTSHLTCFDLGHKSVASEMNFPRVKFLDTNGKQIGQSEEHLVVENSNDEIYQIGDHAYAIPVHICPTVAKYKKVITIVHGEIAGSWDIAARDHQLNI